MAKWLSKKRAGERAWASYAPKQMPENTSICNIMIGVYSSLLFYPPRLPTYFDRTIKER